MTGFLEHYPLSEVIQFDMLSKYSRDISGIFRQHQRYGGKNLRYSCYRFEIFPEYVYAIGMTDTTRKEPRDPRERFVELANKRVNNAIRDLRLIGNLSSRKTYSYTEKDAQKIIRALQKELNDLKSRFSGDDGPDGSNFSL